jgi:branched-chain amino acid transport system ATP-binding protein
MAELLIDAKGLNTYYGASHILRGIDFAVGRGETIGLMGRNGMGKSTLLKSLMGLVKPRSGTVRIMGRDMTGRPPYEVARLGIAYVPEGRGIFGNLSVVENLKMAARAGTRGQREWTYERVRESGISSIIVDKNWKHVTQITDRNVILVKGEVVFAGSSDELRSRPQLLEQYLGV